MYTTKETTTSEETSFEMGEKLCQLLIFYQINTKRKKINEEWNKKIKELNLKMDKILKQTLLKIRNINDQ